MGFGWVDGGVFAGHGSLDADADCGCATDTSCDDANVDTVDTCTNLTCSNVVPAPLPNDAAANAIAVAAGTTVGTLLGAGGTKDVWYRYTASSPMEVAFTTCI